MWKREKAYMQSVDSNTENYAVMFSITKNGASCPHEAKERVERWRIAVIPGKEPKRKPRKTGENKE
jgi:hypothetical protein